MAYDKKVVGIIESAVNDDGKANAAIPEGTIYKTPSRFRMKDERYWYNGFDESICFSVDSEDVFIAGFCVVGVRRGLVRPTYGYEAEMSNGDVNLFQRLNGSFTANDCVQYI